MGMYDDIRVRNLGILPGLTPEEKKYLTRLNDGCAYFQTKDTDCIGDVFELSENGNLLLEEYELRKIPEAERPIQSMKWVGMFERINTRLVETKFHGYIQMYADVSKDREVPMAEFLLKFIDGHMVEAKRLTDSDEARTRVIRNRSYRMAP